MGLLDALDGVMLSKLHYKTFFDDHETEQIVCDKDNVVDWCIVLVEMSLT